MSYKTIMVVLPSPQAAQEILPAALEVARRFDAHLIGMHIRQLYEFHPDTVSVVSVEIQKKLEQDTEAMAAATRAIFDEKTRVEEFVSEWREESTFQSRISAKLIDAALRADLIVMSAKDWWYENARSVATLHDVIIGTGRPVLMIPEGYGDKPIGKQVMVCWTPTREASSATHAAIPFCREADLVTVLTVARKSYFTEADATEGHEVARMLDRHGIETTVWHREQEEPTIGAQIVKEARISGSDLIVMGAFGHSALHDAFFNDATRQVMRESDTPVLFSS